MSCTPVAAVSIAYITVSSQPLPMKNNAPKKHNEFVFNIWMHTIAAFKSFGMVWGMQKSKCVTLKKDETDSGLFLSILSFVRGKDCSLYDVTFG
jgi:hypothetical protein